MSAAVPTLSVNLRWELLRLVRSQRIWLLVIPPVAGPIGSVVADLYLRIPSAATAEILGLLVTAGLAALVLLDLVALAVGEDLVRRAHLSTFVLPQDRRWALGGRLLVAVGGPMGGFALGGLLILGLGGAFVSPSPTSVAPLFPPAHLFLAVPGLLLALAGVTAAASVITRSASEGIVAGVLAGVVVAGVIAALVVRSEVGMWVPAALALGGIGALVGTCGRYATLSA